MVAISPMATIFFLILPIFFLILENFGHSGLFLGSFGNVDDNVDDFFWGIFTTPRNLACSSHNRCSCILPHEIPKTTCTLSKYSSGVQICPGFRGVFRAHLLVICSIGQYPYFKSFLAPIISIYPRFCCVFS